jgi:hypothetical protein
MGLFTNPLSHAGYPPNVTGTPYTQPSEVRAATVAEVDAGVIDYAYVSPATLTGGGGSGVLGARTLNGALYGTGPSTPLGATAAGTTGQVLTATTSAPPAFAALGTGSGLTANGVLLGGGTGPFTATAALTSGQTLVGVTGGPPVAQTVSNAKVTAVSAFNSIPVISANTGGVGVVTINHVNLWAVPQNGAYFEQYNTVATQVIAPTLSATAGNGLNLDTMTGANSASIEITEGNSVNSKNAFVIGTSPAFYVQASFNIATLANVADVYVGFRKVQAYQATIPAGYTDYAVYGVHGAIGLIESQTQIGSGGNVITSSSVEVTAGVVFTVRINVSATGVVTYQINGGVSAPSIYTFTSALTVIPYIIYTTAAGGHSEVDLVAYQCGLQ